MKRRTASLCIFLICFLMGSFCGASTKKARKFIWEVRSKHGTVYLLGSIHLMKKDIYPLDSVIEDAFRRSDVLAVEANINNFNVSEAGKIAEKSLYPPGDSLKNHVSQETYEMVKEEAAEIGLPVEILDTQRPWFLALMFTSFELMKEGFNPRYGIDRHFLSEAEGHKKIIELESLDYQINLLSDLSESEQEMFLMYTLKDVRRLGTDTDKMLDAWKTGDGEEMASLLSEGITEDKGLVSFYNKLLYERNSKMARKIGGFLRTDRTYFVVVGAGHLVGDSGIIEILKEKGYHVKQL